jgi:two-component system chemotaxis sensor kinase CheA
MPEALDQSRVELQESIDELSTRLVLDGPGANFVAALIRLSEHAGGCGYAETARVAAEIAGTLSNGAPNAASPATVTAQIARLSRALENEAHARPQAQPQTAPAAPLPLGQDPELVGDFVLESREHLASIESRMLLLEQNPNDMEAVHSVFRGFHTIKGLAGFLEFPDIQEVAHEVETLLDQARNSKLAITPAVVDVVLENADFLKQAIAGVEACMAGNAAPAAADPHRLIARIRAVMSGEGAPAAPAAEAKTAAIPEKPAPSVSAAAPKAQIAPAANPAEIPAPAPPAPATPPNETAAKTADAVSVRVETGKLDYLMDMVGEMVIAQSLIRHNPGLATLQDPRLQGDLSQLARITGEVQRTAMGMRMLPIGQLFQRTARLVRDLSRKAGKQVELETKGEDTELDKTIAEELADPLMHMVRNAIDHGIERPEARVAAGKNPTARLRLAAYHQGGQIVVEISDDGRGLNREKILKKARQNGLVEEGAQLGENEAFRLIFEPGFSTAEQVTDISGRGVGMDVVRKHVQKLRGRIDIQSEPGVGTTFFLKLPLTLAIIEGLVVVVGSERYIVPIFAVREMFRPTRETISTVRGRDEMAQVRGRLLPVVRLYRRFGVRPRTEDPCEGLLVVAECEGRLFCLLVDDLVGKQEVVIKSLGETLKNIAGIAGGAILGDGRVGLILDMDGVFRGVTRE